MNPDDDPLAFNCPRCGLRMAVTHVGGQTDIFHIKPECSSFLARDHAYRAEVLRLDALKRESV